MGSHPSAMASFTSLVSFSSALDPEKTAETEMILYCMMRIGPRLRGRARRPGGLNLPKDGRVHDDSIRVGRGARQKGVGKRG